MNIEKERAEFEAWLVVSFPGIRIERLEDQRYVSLEAHFMFEAYQAGRAALQSQDREGAFCVWHNDPETDNSWDTGCRQLFELYDGTPSENRMSFCCYCGKPIQEAIDHARRAEGDGE